MRSILKSIAKSPDWKLTSTLNLIELIYVINNVGLIVRSEAKTLYYVYEITSFYAPHVTSSNEIANFVLAPDSQQFPFPSAQIDKVIEIFFCIFRDA
jgi:hypothetical protein